MSRAFVASGRGCKAGPRGVRATRAGSSWTCASTLATTRTSGVMNVTSASAFRRSAGRPASGACGRHPTPELDMTRLAPGALASSPRPGQRLRGCPRSRPARARCSWPPRHRPRRADSRLGVVVGDAEKCGHRSGCLLAGPCASRRLGRPPGGSVVEAQSATGDQRRVLAEAVTCAGGRLSWPFTASSTTRLSTVVASCAFSVWVNSSIGCVQEEVCEVPLRGRRRLFHHFPRGVVTMAHPYRHVAIPVRGR